MSTFNGTNPGATYKDLLQLPTANAGISTSLVQVQDGAGTNLKVWLSTTTTQFQDASLRIANTTTPTKLIQFDLSAITAANTRTLIVPDSNVTLLGLEGGTMTGLLVLSADPSVALGAATKQYVDAHAGGGSGYAKQLAYGGL
jgi:hypothetical protein